ncbi:pre-rRNA processing [Saxophila tyrrhenica]|uniref:Pre-rRNA processing n=1 Tax=Saxophila tyrrhenica TaxID=1690608 RepID=A0AAV9PHC3_9PEZI|nr:pre-rRNA processing [Saxophila tyrrhenica]
MDEDVSPPIEEEEQFWDELERVLKAPCETHEDIDDALRSFLALTTEHRKDYVQTEYDFAQCCYRLLNSPLYSTHSDYVRRQILYCLLQEDDDDVLHISVAFLIYDGRTNENGFSMLQGEGTFPRLVQLIRDKRDNDYGLHKLLLELLYEISRSQRLNRDDLVTVDDPFILHLLDLIEHLSDDADDPYHYPIIRVLLVLNEQYMCHPHPSDPPLTNRILKLLSAHGPSYRTFGENLILLLNRESTLSNQLLILKLLYLLFTTPQTFEYFYTNDLHVLVDVIIRNLLDLDPGSLDARGENGEEGLDGQRALRHTYLRVLCPLLKNTQLAKEGGNYKRIEVRRLLHLLVNRSSAHFAPVDGTVLRLVIRCRQVDWIWEEGDEEDEEMAQKLAGLADDSPTGEVTDKAVAKKMLGMGLEEAGVSNLSVVDVSADLGEQEMKPKGKQKPDAPAPRRKSVVKQQGEKEKERGREKPVVPAPRRRRGKKVDGMNGEEQHTNGKTMEGLKPPPGDAGEDGREGRRDRSPFADENGET